MIPLKNESTKSHCDAANLQVAATPVMQQYLQLKSQYVDCLLFYRMGDFYELFFEDAHTAARILDIALTKRGKHAGDDIAMCGVPVHAAENYLLKLIASGYKIAICEQLETPEEARARGYKAIVRRDVVRVVTPGTITEESLLAPSASSYLAAVYIKDNKGSIGWLDVSTGAFFLASVTRDDVASLLARISPKELLVCESQQNASWLAESDAVMSANPDHMFDVRKGEAALKAQYHVSALDGFGDFTATDLSVCGALLHYLRLTQMGAMLRLDVPRKEMHSEVMQIDAATRRSLELTHTQSGERKGSLLAAIDRTVSAAGGRALQQALAAPLTQKPAIDARLDAVAWAVEHTGLRQQLRETLKSSGDMERAVTRLVMRRGGPRDVLLVRETLKAASAIADSLQYVAEPLLRDITLSLSGFHPFWLKLHEAFKAEVPLLARDGGFIADGYRADLDEWRTLSQESKRVMAAMEAKLKQDTDISSLKIRFNNILGYFIEITSIHEKKVPISFIHRQTMSGAMRYTTTELSELAQKMEQANDRAIRLELEIFDELLAQMDAHATKLVAAARALGQCDMLLALGELACDEGYMRPRLCEDTRFTIEGGRHPVIEPLLRKQGKSFMENGCVLDEGQKIWLITGPNMAGKSTFLRQNALIAILAHMGSFVPAVRAEIGLMDRVFSRVGAADDLARGQSTFMVEMLETAAILHQATARSLVILDEIGRGTATYDGLAIAWAVVEYLHDITGCRALFATHYHELTELACERRHVANRHTRVQEYREQIIFLHQIAEGSAKHSYGVHVAQLAGLPKSVTTRAKTLLQQFESGRSVTHSKQGEFLLAPAVAQSAPNPLYEAVLALDPDALSPKQALDILFALKALV